MKSRLKLTIFILTLFFCLIPVFSHAQIPTSIDGILMETYPKIPAPGDTVSISIESYATDLNAASIVWFVDGKEYAKGVGKKSIDTGAPLLGKTKNILVVIKTVEGREIKKILTLKSGGVDLIWESAGHTPPLYEGKASYVYENEVRFIAIPHIAGTNGMELDPTTLVYKWTLNDKVIQDQSGYGKQVLTVREDIPRSLDVLVEVSTKNGSDKASKTTSLTPGNPSISFYEDNALYGVLYNESLTSKINLENQEVSIVAVPFGFNSTKESPLSFLWSVNNVERKDLSTNESIILRTKGDVEGSSSISLEIRNVDNILQGARNGLTVLFSKKAEDSSPTF